MRDILALAPPSFSSGGGGGGADLVGALDILLLYVIEHTLASQDATSLNG
jgi:hypothetical protein